MQSNTYCMTIFTKLTPALFAALLIGCSAPEMQSEPSEPESPQAAFFEKLSGFCGKAFTGKLVSSDDADSDMAGQSMTMHVRDCNDDTIRIPFNVGNDRSRTWVISKTDNGLRLKHDHRHEDGSKDAVTWYGGDTVDQGTAERQEFPVDDESITLFKKEGLDVSVTNVWAVEITDAIFAYELSRNNRFFRVEFDVTNPVEAPPASWGSEK